MKRPEPRHVAALVVFVALTVAFPARTAERPPRPAQTHERPSVAAPALSWAMLVMLMLAAERQVADDCP